MGCPRQAIIGYDLVFGVRTFSGGIVPIDADSVPTYSIYKTNNDTPVATGSMSKLNDANTTGLYAASIDVSSTVFARFESYNIDILATIGGVLTATTYSFVCMLPEDLTIASVAVLSETRTRAEIIAMVREHTGVLTGKTTVITNACNDALKLAVIKHAFRDASTQLTDIPITQGAIYVDIPIGSYRIITARIIDTDGDRASKLIMRSRVWWDNNVITPEHNSEKYPTYGLRWGDKIRFDSPCSSGLSLRLRVLQIPAFLDDTSLCPIEELDIFVEKYATAYLFLDVEQFDSYRTWREDAIQTLNLIISADDIDIAEENVVSAPKQASESGIISSTDEGGDTHLLRDPADFW